MKILRIADLFCGAGGTSMGAVEAIEMLGLRADLTAINHWPVAIATHSRNHPKARHLTTSIDNINPRDLYSEGELDLLWASPECTHHSVARGGKPINDQSRATAWCVVRWAEALRPNVILVENVPEFATWGPIGTNGRPMQSRKGEVFQAWKTAIESLGYKSGHAVFCAADYGDPTTRRRLFIQFVRGRRQIVWPGATHSPKAAGDLFGSRQAWVPARDIIDWSIPGQSIFDRKKPLSPKTLKRIEAGLKKFGFKAFVATTSHGNSSKKNSANWNVHPVDAPLGSVTSAQEKALVEPYLVELRGTSEDQLAYSARSVTDPIPTITAGGGHIGLCDPFLVQVAHGNGTDPKGDERRSKSVDDVFPTVCGQRGEWAVCEPGLLPQQSDGVLRPVSEPSPTVATSGAIALVEPFIIPIDHTGTGSNPSNSIDTPLSTVCTENRHAVVEPFLVEYYGTGGAESVDEPLNTVTSKPRFGLARPVIEIRGEKYLLDIRFRMLQPHELSAAQGFPKDYQFTGNKTEQVKQIGNAVPRNLARALVLAALSQQSDISGFFKTEEAA